VHDIPDAFLSHRISGRARLKIPSKKGDFHYFKSAKEQLPKCNGIETVEVNSMSGSVLIIHASDIEKIAEYARNSNIFNLKNNRPDSANLYSTVSKAFKDINGKVRGITGGDMDIAGAAFLILLGLGIYQISRGNFVAPAWYTAFWYALSIFLQSVNKGGNNLTEV
jgi:hypothetical protein